MRKALWIILAVLLADQALKIWVKTSFTLGEDLVITDWFILHFTENPGMAWGFEFGGSWGKLLLSLFRIATVIAIFYWLKSLVARNIPQGGIVAVALILAGALGNIIDSAFYGLIFEASDYNYVATAFSEDGGYAPFLFGKVFNLADTAISTGVGLLILYQKSVFQEEKKEEPTDANQA
jgi:signal peptidase II